MASLRFVEQLRSNPFQLDNPIPLLLSLASTMTSEDAPPTLTMKSTIPGLRGLRAY